MFLLFFSSGIVAGANNGCVVETMGDDNDKP